MIDYLERLFGGKYIKKSEMFQRKPIHYGAANRDKIIYYIDEDDKNVGFFAMYRWWLEYLYFADICGYMPVICAGSHFSYREKEAIDHTTNPFEYYFLQPAGISLQEAKVSNQVIMADQTQRAMVELILTGKMGNYKYNKQYLQMMARIVKKYIKLNQSTQDFINKGMKEINFEQDKMLGVHIRGTDFRAMYDNHPIYVTEEECFAEVDKLLEKSDYSRVFLATDDQRILERFLEHYGRQVCFYTDVERSDKNRSVAFRYSKRDRNKYLLGLEVIRDMYTLSLCEGLIAGISQVAICAQIHKLSRKEKYKDIKIIDKGLYSNNHYYSRRMWR